MSAGTRSFFFGTTLSEIGFILFFALLLFAFFQMDADKGIIEGEQQQNEELEKRLASKDKEITAKEKELESKARQLEATAKLSQLPPETLDKFFDELVPMVDLQVENEDLVKENEGLQTRLSELSVIEEQLTKLAADNSTSSESLSEALSIKKALEEIADSELETISPEQVVEAVEMATAINQFNQNAEMPITNKAQLTERLNATGTIESFRRENDDLKGRVANLRGRLGGRDLPPCWANKDSGKIEYIFSIVILEDGLLISKAAPEYRNSEYKNLANTAQLTSGLLNLDSFRSLAEPLLEHSDSLGCRHYVSITDKSENAYKSTLTIEDYFYKYVNRTQ